MPATAGATDQSADADADLRKAAMLHRGGETPRAIAIWEAWAGRGNVDAAYNLAVIHQHADGVAYDASIALRWYRVAAERGDKVSQFQLGLMYLNGEGVPADEAQAHAWFVRNRHEHAHHHHSPQLQQWQRQARALIEERDRREAFAAARRDGDMVLAELRRRAGLPAEPQPDPVRLASAATAGGH
jgi:hypothetical protein